MGKKIKPAKDVQIKERQEVVEWARDVLNNNKMSLEEDEEESIEDVLVRIDTDEVPSMEKMRNALRDSIHVCVGMRVVGTERFASLPALMDGKKAKMMMRMLSGGKLKGNIDHSKMVEVSNLLMESFVRKWESTPEYQKWWGKYFGGAKRMARK